MNYSIETCSITEKSTTAKGHVLEKLASDLLKVQQYEVTQEIRITGMEIDVLAEHTLKHTRVFVECKAWDSNSIPGDVITKLAGNVLIKGVDEGWLIFTGILSKDARGLEEEIRGNEKLRKIISIYTPQKIIKALIDARIILDSKIVEATYKKDAFGEQRVLMVTDVGKFWIMPIIDPHSPYITAVKAFNASTGSIITDPKLLDELKAKSNTYSDFQWIVDCKQTNPDISRQIDEEYSSIVQVLCGDDWRDYRPARPEDFVGRKNIIQDIFLYFKAVIDDRSRTRVFSLKAPSGMGKSSVVLKIDSIAKKKSKKYHYFTYCVDVRTAMSSRYVEMVLKSCFFEADKAGFTDVKNRSISALTVEQFFEESSIISTLQYLKRNGKCIVIIFDQFEELISKKELFSLFKKIQALCNVVDAIQGRLILGFSWKTDLTLPAEHPAYFWWSNLSDRRKEFELSQFTASEIKSAIMIFGKQLGEKIDPILSNYLARQCQGYPWLLKKLCIHVFNLIKDGNSQESVIGQKLNIVDLFQRDIAELSPDQESCLKEIALQSPANYFDIVNLYRNEVVKSLVDNRLVIRRASKLTLYWDIFKDYVINKIVPALDLDYIPQHQYSSIANIVVYLLKNNNIDSNKVCTELSLKASTLDNAMIDMVMFGIASRTDGIIQLTYTDEAIIINTLQNFFKKHIVYQALKKQHKEGFDYNSFVSLFNSLYTNTNLSLKTQKIYSAKLFKWFECLDLVYGNAGIYKIKESSMNIGLLRNASLSKRRNNRNYNGDAEAALFWGSAPYAKIKELYDLLTDGNSHTYSELKERSFRNAYQILRSMGFVTISNRILIVDSTYEEIIDSIAKSPTMSFAIDLFKGNSDINSVQLGKALNHHFSRNWSESSIKRYGNAMLNWVRYICSK